MAKCRICSQRGRCSCQRRINASVAGRPADQPRPCGQMCGWNGKGTVCGRDVRSGVCPCLNC
jgi:hypothetical protein